MSIFNTLTNQYKRTSAHRRGNNNCGSPAVTQFSSTWRLWINFRMRTYLQRCFWEIPQRFNLKLLATLILINQSANYNRESLSAGTFFPSLRNSWKRFSRMLLGTVEFESKVKQAASMPTNNESMRGSPAYTCDQARHPKSASPAPVVLPNILALGFFLHRYAQFRFITFERAGMWTGTFCML